MAVTVGCLVNLRGPVNVRLKADATNVKPLGRYERLTPLGWAEYGNQPVIAEYLRAQGTR